MANNRGRNNSGTFFDSDKKVDASITSLASLPTTVLLELFKDMSLVELKKLEVNRRLKEIVELHLLKEYLVPPEELITIVRNSNTDGLNLKTKSIPLSEFTVTNNKSNKPNNATIKVPLVNGSVIATYVTIPLARKKKMENCNPEDRGFLFNEWVKFLPTQTKAKFLENKPETSAEYFLITKGFIDINDFERAIKLQEREDSFDSEYQRVFFTSFYISSLFQKGKISEKDALACVNDDVIAQLKNQFLNIPNLENFILNGLSIGFTPQQIQTLLNDINLHSILDFDFTNNNQRHVTGYWYKIAGITTDKLLSCDPETLKWFISSDRFEAIDTIMKCNVHIFWDDLISLSIAQIKSIFNLKNLVTLLKYGVTFSEISKIDSKELADLDQKITIAQEVKKPICIYGEVEPRPVATFKSIKDIFNDDKLIRLCEYFFINNIASLNEADRNLLCNQLGTENNTFSAMISFEVNIKIRPEKILRTLLENKIPLGDLLNLSKQEARFLLISGFENICKLSSKRNIPLRKLADLYNEELNDILNTPTSDNSKRIFERFEREIAEEITSPKPTQP